MLIAWTTVAEKADATRLAHDVVAGGLAVCVQIEGPIASIYRWQGKLEAAQEYRLMLKLLPEHRVSLQERILQIHPYDTPEWMVVRAEDVGEKYLSWARANSSTPPL